MREYLRPWKLITLIVGIGFLLVGALFHVAPDWDIPISFIMAFFTYLTAPWSLRSLIERKWRKWPLAMFYTWFSVDGCYALYWHFRNPEALDLMRDANFWASLCLYGMCGLVWLYQGSVKEMFADIRGLLWRNGR